MSYSAIFQSQVCMAIESYIVSFFDDQFIIGWPLDMITVKINILTFPTKGHIILVPCKPASQLVAVFIHIHKHLRPVFAARHLSLSGISHLAITRYQYGRM